MKNYKLNIITRIALSMAFIFTLGLTSSVAETPAKPTQSIVDIAVSNDNFTILVEALQKADLVNALNGDGPFTVFAPTDEAFEALFNELGVDGINDLTKDQLTPILLYHVVSGNVMAESVKTGKVETLNSEAKINVKKSSKGVTLNGNSKVVMTDIAATNGVIHVIDAVLVPGADKKDSAKADKGSCS